MKTEQTSHKDAYPPIAKDGYLYIAVGVAFCFAAYSWGSTLLTVLFALATFFVVWFFRDPKRSSPQTDGIVLSPADGTILSIKPIHGDLDIGSGTVVCIFMSVFNVHVNRCPITGSVSSLAYHAGRFLSAFKNDAPEENERNAVVFENDTGKIKCVQIAGLVARRIVCRLKKADTVTAGQRFGLIKFGSRVDVYIPSPYQPMVKAGDKVKGGLTSLARVKGTGT